MKGKYVVSNFNNGCQDQIILQELKTGIVCACLLMSVYVCVCVCSGNSTVSATTSPAKPISIPKHKESPNG